MSNSNIFKWGLIGPGRIAHNFAKGLEMPGTGQLWAVASRDQDRAKSFADQYQAAHVYANYDELIASDVDAIYIATPHRYHFEQALQCLQAGKAVLCEKPLCMNTQQVQRLVDAAKENNVFLMEALWTRFQPVWSQVKQWIDSGRIGSIQQIQASMGFRFPYDVNDRVFNKELAGGGLLDMGVYPLAMTQWLLPEFPQSLIAQGVIGDTGVDEQVQVMMDYGNRQFAQCFVTVTSTPANEFIINGTEGRIRLDSMFWLAPAAHIDIFDPSEDNKNETVAIDFEATGFEYQTRHVVECMEAGLTESPIMPLTDSLQIHRLMDDIRTQIGLSYDFE